MSPLIADILSILWRIENLSHLSYSLFLISYATRKMLWLRLMTIAAQALLVPFYYFRENPVMESVWWMLVFILINSGQVALLMWERKAIELEPEADMLYRRVFRALTPLEFKRLMGVGNWRSVAAGEPLIEQGKPVPEMFVIATGKVGVKVDGAEVAQLGPGSFLGEMSFISGEMASATVVAAEDTRYLGWEVGPLKAFLAKREPIQMSLQYILGKDVVSKLRGGG